jgi:hypothetical protein
VLPHDGQTSFKTSRRVGCFSNISFWICDNLSAFVSWYLEYRTIIAQYGKYEGQLPSEYFRGRAQFDLTWRLRLSWAIWPMTESKYFSHLINIVCVNLNIFCGKERTLDIRHEVFLYSNHNIQSNIWHCIVSRCSILQYLVGQSYMFRSLMGLSSGIETCRVF